VKLRKAPMTSMLAERELSAVKGRPRSQNPAAKTRITTAKTTHAVRPILTNRGLIPGPKYSVPPDGRHD
jgi:hypothetical protein